jgi:hypothetical protein
MATVAPEKEAVKGFKPTPTLPSRVGDARAKLPGHSSL